MEYGQAAPDANVETKALFRIEIDNIQLMAFEKCTIGASEWNVMENRTGIDSLTKQRYSSSKKPVDVTITKNERDGGAEDINQIITWHQAGSLDRRSGAIIQLNREGEEIRRFNFRSAWVSKYTPPDHDAGSDTDPMAHEFVLAVGEFSWA